MKLTRYLIIITVILFLVGAILTWVHFNNQFNTASEKLKIKRSDVLEAIRLDPTLSGHDYNVDWISRKEYPWGKYWGNIVIRKFNKTTFDTENTITIEFCYKNNQWELSDILDINEITGTVKTHPPNWSNVPPYVRKAFGK
mgnify:CR=1 FL=1